jgi:hypothetical protein
MLVITGVGHLTCACSEGDPDVIRLLLEYKSDVNASRKNGKWTPFTMAMGRCHPIVKKNPCASDCEVFDIVKMLLKNGQSTNIKTNKMTPIEHAISRRCISIVKLLIKHNADPKHSVTGAPEIEAFLGIFSTGWKTETHKHFSKDKRNKIETFIKLYSGSWLSKIPKSLIYLICNRMSRIYS